MKTRLYATLVGLIVLGVVFLPCREVQATLGGSVDSVGSDREALSAVKRAAQVYNGYTVVEIVSPANTVREYISPAGIVFGIAWNGLSHPDLKQLLGCYSGEYEKTLQQTPRKHGIRRIQIKTDRTVVEKWGHMRNLKGRAYVPDLIPSGVNIDEIK
ncbi:MAG: DUF2844 domain-containing protein [Nitrospirae bacterium]|nr:DUF2844 domain-containing protein [Nitrospirota bacterium]